MEKSRKTKPSSNRKNNHGLLNDNRKVDLDGYENTVQQEGSKNILFLLVKGVHCASCIQRIETKISQYKNVSFVRLNFSTGRLKIEWKGDPSEANLFANDILNLGYQVFPFNPDLDKSLNDKENLFLLMCLGVAGFAMGNIMLLSVGLWTSTTETMGMATREFLHWVSALIAIPAVIFSGRPFFYSAFSALKNRQSNMDVPISVALILTLAMSLFETVDGGEHVYFDSSVMLMFFLLVGRYLDFRARRITKNAATDLMNNFSGFVNVVENGKSKKYTIRDLKQGMIVRVSMGEKIPVDGVLIEGETMIDASLITGETVPVSSVIGDTVFGGTLNISSSILMRVEKVANDSILSDVIRLIEKAEQGQAKYVRIADKVSKFYTPVVHILALSAFFFWFLLGTMVWQDALMIAVTVLIITCPCALGLAVPIVQVLASAQLMKKNILLKTGDALERLSSIDTIVFDKTGTLTLGKPVLQGEHDDDILKLAASLAVHSQHPFSRAIVKSYNGTLLNIQHVQEITGSGIEGIYKNKKIRLGKKSWCGDVSVSSSLSSEVWLDIEGKKPTVFYIEDMLRPDCEATIKMFQKEGIQTIILSGDKINIVSDIAKKISIELFKAEQSPIDKYNFLEELKKEGKKVLMVGDGLNDAPVLSVADVSMAPGSAIDMAQNAADIIFMGDSLSSVYTAYKISCFAQKLIKVNFILAAGYNIVAIPVAFIGLVTPMIAALAMSFSSLIVVMNSFRLRIK